MGLNRRFSAKALIGWACLALAFVGGLSVYKRNVLERVAHERLDELQPLHVKLREKIDAGVDPSSSDGARQLREITTSVGSLAGLEKVRLLSADGVSLFDSDEVKSEPTRSVVAAVRSGQIEVFARGFHLEILLPAGRVTALYELNVATLELRFIGALVAGLAAILILAWIAGDWMQALVSNPVPIRLRAKFLAAIVLISLFTAGIIFVNLTVRQTHDQTERIEKQSMIFTRYATGRVVDGFVQNFEKAFYERFVPEIRELIASNEDLVRIRIVAVGTGNVLFDSEKALAGGNSARRLQGVEKAEYPIDLLKQIRAQRVASQKIEHSGESFFEVVNDVRPDGKSSLFMVEYLFSYDSLTRSLAAIRWEILKGLIPSVVIGLLVALVFAQLLISPIYKLVAALGRVTTGDYGVTVANHSRDEVGDLVRAFNSMTQELKRKRELRKYLSNSSYQQIIGASEQDEGRKLGGQRVHATILFSDIRDFVGHCESMEAEEVTSMLNEYFSEMVDVVHKNGGEVDKFIGDAILAVFHAEEGERGARSASSCLQAIYCGLQMKERLAEFNARRSAAGKNTIEIGIGIADGEIISGPIGSEDRMDFTVIGDVVNVASRIEKLSKEGRHTRVVFSHPVEEKVRGLLDYEELKAEPVRGKKETVHVYELIGIKDLSILELNLVAGAFNDVDPTLRRRSVELLGQSGNRAAIQPILSVLGDDDEQVRTLAVVALTKLSAPDEPQVLDALFRRAQEEKSFKVLSTVIAGLGKVCRSDRIEVLEPFLRSSDERIVANTVEALGQTRSPVASDLILPLLNSKNNRIKANAAMALFAAGHVEVIDTLKPMLMHSDALMRSSAAFAIGELTTIADLAQMVAGLKNDPAKMRFYLAEIQDCVPMLVALLKDSDLRVKRQAVTALGKIRDKAAILPMIEVLDLSHMDDGSDISGDILDALRAIGSHKLVREVLSKLT